MAKEIVWSPQAREELIEILQYWIDRNKTITYSKKLNSLIEDQLKITLEFPMIGRKTDILGVYIKVIKKYLLFYEMKETKLYVLSIRDGRRNLKAISAK